MGKRRALFLPGLGGNRGWVGPVADGLRPTLLLDFAAGRYAGASFGSGVTFTRAGTATYHDAAGLMQTAAVDVPRIDCDPVTGTRRGLLVEDTRTNLLTWSEDLSNAAWAKTNTVVVGQKVAPNGAGMTKIAWTAASGQQHSINRTGLPIAMTIGQVFAVTVDVEPAEMTKVQLHVQGTDIAYPVINLATGVVVGGGNGYTTVEKIGAICRIRMICTATATTGYLIIWPNGTGTGAGDGTSGLWIGRVQVEAGNCATSYIPTTSAATTRSGDNPALTLGGWWNAAEGAMLVEWQDINQQSSNTRIIGMDGSRTLMSLAASVGQNNAIRLDMWNGVEALSATAAADITKGIRRGVAGWSAAGRSVAVSGVLGTTATPLWNAGSPTVLYLGTSGTGLRINGYLRRITYYPRRFSDAQLLTMIA